MERGSNADIINFVGIFECSKLFSVVVACFSCF